MTTEYGEEKNNNDTKSRQTKRTSATTQDALYYNHHHQRYDDEQQSQQLSVSKVVSSATKEKSKKGWFSLLITSKGVLRYGLQHHRAKKWREQSTDLSNEHNSTTTQGYRRPIDRQNKQVYERTNEEKKNEEKQAHQHI
eukprot:CAMPEP_0177664930 /NCGR_PEP_ID=MMETSP0447-20121125/20777_1 /TAXON_ID=0 /ORGANISM="Stygamoeba regulata, Strain BSH-02190019" /LENGTH=138 /DNA_ID=CAMNT_0019170977 /DNA_START=591 /DNA_END=1005 /DNA_ORIENTATION=+